MHRLVRHYRVLVRVSARQNLKIRPFVELVQQGSTVPYLWRHSRVTNLGFPPLALSPRSSRLPVEPRVRCSHRVPPATMVVGFQHRGEQGREMSKRRTARGMQSGEKSPLRVVAAVFVRRESISSVESGCFLVLLTVKLEIQLDRLYIHTGVHVHVNVHVHVCMCMCHVHVTHVHVPFTLRYYDHNINNIF